MNHLTLSPQFKDTRRIARYKTLLMMVVALSILFFCSATVRAETQIYHFDSPEQEKLFYELAAELRCPQCQNNNIAESNAGLSADMRAKVYELVQEGYTKDDVVQYMIDRYGHFITYDPPFTAATAIMWVAPLLILILGITIVIIRSRAKAVSPLSVAESPQEINDTLTTADQLVTSPATSTEKIRFFAISLITLVLVTGMAFYLTQDWQLIRYKKDSIAAFEQLKTKYAQKNITTEQVQQLAIGLRDHLDKNPKNAADWQLLGELYRTVLGRHEDAKHAYDYAYALEPESLTNQSNYAQMLWFTSRVESDRQHAIEILSRVVSLRPSDIGALYVLAMHYQGTEQYMQSINLWSRTLKQLPEGSNDYFHVQAELEKDKKRYEDLLKR